MPDDDTWPDSLKQIYEDFGQVAGPTARGRLETYSELADSGRPAETHFHVGMLAVDPRYHRRGLGRLLLDAVQAMSEAHPSSTGVALDTENPESRAFYERCGYHVTHEAQFETITVWNLFRPNGAR